MNTARNPNGYRAEETYWIVIAGLRGAGKSKFIQHAAEVITLRDSQDMSVITPAENEAIMAWLARTGGAMNPDAPFQTEDEVQFARWTRRIMVGEIALDARTRVCFYEAPGTRDFTFLGSVIKPETLLGTVIMIDSTQHATVRDASRIAATFAAYAPDEPYVFAANKQDHPEALPPEDVRILLQFLDGHLLPVLPCVATRPLDVQKVLLALLERIRDSYDDGIEW